MKTTHVSEATHWLRSHTAAVQTMLTHFNEYRVVAGSGIKNGSCCAVSLSPGQNYVFGNSQANLLDWDAFRAGKGHAEVIAFKLSQDQQGAPQRIFCELSPCPACQQYFAASNVEIIYLFEYPNQIQAWKDFHAEDIGQQIAYFRQQAGL